MVGRVDQSIGGDTVLCGTETGRLFGHVQEFVEDIRVVAATPNADTYNTLSRAGVNVVRLSVRVEDKFRQARHTIAMTLKADKVTPGDLVVCAIGHELCHTGGDLILVTDVERTAGDIALSELIKLTDGIRPTVLEMALEMACKIGRVARRGKRIDALLVIGDSGKVIEQCKQLILNPFHGHEDADRNVTNVAIHEMLVELNSLT